MGLMDESNPRINTNCERFVRYDSIKSRLQVYKDTTSKFLVVKSLSDGLCYINKGMVSLMLFSKTKLKRVGTPIVFQKLIDSNMYNFFQNFIQIREK